MARPDIPEEVLKRTWQRSGLEKEIVFVARFCARYRAPCLAMKCVKPGPSCGKRGRGRGPWLVLGKNSRGWQQVLVNRGSDRSGLERNCL